MRTENRLIVENLSSRVSWQVSLGNTQLFMPQQRTHTRLQKCIQK